MTPDAAPRRKRTRFWVPLIAAALVAGGGIAAVVSVNTYKAETARLCDVALENAETAHNAAQEAAASATDALTAVENTELPAGGTSTAYADRKAVEEVKAQKAEGDKPEVKAVPARQSGADFVKDVTDAKAGLAEAEEALAEACETRDDAEQATAQAKAVTDAAKALDTASTALTEDFALFQADEAARLAAEKKAAEEAAAAEAARQAAEQAAAEEAVRQAAEQQSWDSGNSGNSGNWGGDGGGNPGGGGGSNGGGTQIAPPPGQSGGGCPPDKPICYG
ncbi:hypothetical protein [Leucobacter massiliensis]|uniref:Colicin transporter n=1 Tax=Leucobacter massiliensis TaxID=1686285 RepID=A0A2S9QMR4_9MICO|nr:hypothetical protein [Leucobacter massiliensis]PRI10882.1 hypothetical protein B4915_08310 [Leucobacter massiliensis]